MGMTKPSRYAPISGLFRVTVTRRRALRAEAPPEIAQLYDRLDRLQSLDPFPPKGLGVRTGLARCWKSVDRLSGRPTPWELAQASSAIDEVEEAIQMWRGPALMTTGRHGAPG
jgi:hypothetical protein